MNYEQILQAAKDEVAKGYGYKDWEEMQNKYVQAMLGLSLGHYIQEAALLAMQKVAELLTDKKEA